MQRCSRAQVLKGYMLFAQKRLPAEGMSSDVRSKLNDYLSFSRFRGALAAADSVLKLLGDRLQEFRRADQPKATLLAL